MAIQNNLKLIFPDDVNKDIESRSNMPLSKMLHNHIIDFKRIIRVENVTSCKTKRITGIEILSVGEESE